MTPHVAKILPDLATLVAIWAQMPEHIGALVGTVDPGEAKKREREEPTLRGSRTISMANVPHECASDPVQLKLKVSFARG